MSDRMRTSLQGRAASGFTPDEGQRRLADYAGKLWRGRGWVCLHIDSIENDWIRKDMERRMDEQYGKRDKQDG